MPYIQDIQRVSLGPGLQSLVDCVNDTCSSISIPVSIERYLFDILCDLIDRYIRCGCDSWFSKRLPFHSNGPHKELMESLMLFDEDSIEGALNFTITSLIGYTLCDDVRYVWINRSIGLLQRIAAHINKSDYWGDEGIRFGRALGVLRCVELEFYRRIGGPYEDGAIVRNGDIPFYEEHVFIKRDSE